MNSALEDTFMFYKKAYIVSAAKLFLIIYINRIHSGSESWEYAGGVIQGV